MIGHDRTGNRIAGVLIAAAGLLGAVGIAAAAAAAHGFSDERLALSASILLVHAPALLGLASLALPRPRTAMVAGALLTLGAVLFSGDIAARSLLGDRLFPSAAPFGGILMILGWLAASASGILSLFRRGARAAIAKEDP